eukprot:gene30522-19402_t
MIISIVALLASSATPSPSPGVDILSTVFEEGLGNISCFRIPSIVQTTKGTLVAFAEARFGSCNDGAVHELATRRSTDSGKTWSAVATAVGGGGNYVGNPDAVATASGKIILVYVKHSPKCEVKDTEHCTMAAALPVVRVWNVAVAALTDNGTNVVLVGVACHDDVDSRHCTRELFVV